MTFDFISLLIGLFLGGTAGAAAVFFLNRKTEQENIALKTSLEHERQAKEEMGGVFALKAQEALKQNSEQFLQLAQEKIKQAQDSNANDLEKRQKAISDLVDPINRSLKEMGQRVENLGKTGTGLEAQLKTFVDDQRLLREETRNLVQALRNPAARGRWGEMQLQRALEMIGMVEGTHYVQQATVTTEGTRKQPDFIIKLPGNMQIIIDVKTPVEPYWNALDEAGNDAERERALQNFQKTVRNHMKSLGDKEYWRHFEESPEFVVMFLPTEGLYSMAVSNDSGLVEDAAKNNIIVASPTTLMGLLRVAMHGWQQHNMAEEAKKVASLGSDLYNRIAKFGDHMQKLGRNLGTALNAYNDAVGSLEQSVMPGARKFKELHVQTGGREVEELKALESAPRILTSPELLPNEIEEKKRA